MVSLSKQAGRGAIQASKKASKMADAVASGGVKIEPQPTLAQQLYMAKRKKEQGGQNNAGGGGQGGAPGAEAMDRGGG